MYSDVLRGAKYKADLMALIRQVYGLEPLSVEPAKRGFYGETWKLRAACGQYFLKLDYSAHQAVYERSFPALEHLLQNGIDFVSRIVKTTQGDLFTRFDGAVLGVFDWIDGENIETDETKYLEYRMLAQVYSVPCNGLDIPREDFSASVSEEFFRRWKALAKSTHRESAAQADALFSAHQSILEHRAKRLTMFADQCRGDTSHMYLTHGDAGGNLIVQGNKHYIVDWDDPRIAPPERDAWVMWPYGWAKSVFEAALHERGIAYTLRPERLAYYCYYMFFFYLNEHLDCLFETGASEGLDTYFESWVEERIQYAEQMR